MFAPAERGQSVTAEEYEERSIILRQRLLTLQGRLKRADFPVIILFHGVDGAGKGDMAGRLSWWMDPRRIVTRAYLRPTQEERERPEFWRFWRDLPPRGSIGVFLRAWYRKPLLQRAYDRIDDDGLDRQLRQISEFERTLQQEGALLLKFWMHLGRKQQAIRLKALGQHPTSSWRVGPKDWEHWQMYDAFVSAAETMIRRTHTPETPWHVVEGTDPKHRSLEVGQKIATAVEKALDLPQRPRIHTGDERRVAGPEPTLLSDLDLTLALDEASYDVRLAELHAELNPLQRAARAAGVTLVLVFEGFDASGKGGAIRHVTAALDARIYQVIQTGPPSDEEAAHHYLWRFWRHLPRAGRVLIFDRSWYGRVLVERVEGFATQEQWSRAYEEINQFERQLVEKRCVMVKFWIQVSDEEQARRFERRQKTPHKRWKLTSEDWRNREKRDVYEVAVQDMLERTDHPQAPWILVEGDDKRYARVRVLEEVCAALRTRLELGALDRPDPKTG